ncbi:hypothetical protein MRX96_022470 [Rhipicephalus microplus]
MSSSAVSVSVSVWTLVSISMERFFAIVRPLQSRRWQTVSHAYRVIAVIWALSLIHVAPIAVLSQLIPTRTAGHQKCRELWPSDEAEKGFNLYLDSVLLVLPLLIMIFVYAIIVRTLCVGIRLENRSVALGIPMKPVARDQRQYEQFLQRPVEPHRTGGNGLRRDHDVDDQERGLRALVKRRPLSGAAGARVQRRKDAGFRGSRHPHAVRGRGRVLRLLDAAVRGAHLVPVRPGRLSTTGSVRRASAWCTCWPTPRRARTPSPTASCTTSFDKGSWPRSAAAGEGNLAAVPKGPASVDSARWAAPPTSPATTLLYHDTHKKVPNGRGADFV